VAIIGGGLAGLAAAVALADRGWQIELWEARRRLGGRAGSFRDPHSGELVDHCQHVAMGCCTAMLDLLRRTGLADLLRRDRTLHFFASDGRRYDVAGARWLPPPLHLAPSLLRLGYLTFSERWGIARSLLRLRKLRDAESPDSRTVAAWLDQQSQSPAAIEGFWRVVLVSALGESLERVSLAAARKVFVDGFMSTRDAYEILVPRVPLDELYGQRLIEWLVARGARVHLGERVRQVVGDAGQATHLELADGRHVRFEVVILAVPWRQVAPLVDDRLKQQWPGLANLERIESSPITAVHLTYDRPITDLPHAVLIGRLSQWLFARPAASPRDVSIPRDYDYQVVISASGELRERSAQSIAAQVQAELADVFPEAATATLVKSRVVTQREAVFSVQPGAEQYRPDQQTPIANLMLAGDWTNTLWPSTMESAVRSGYLAAGRVLERAGEQHNLSDWRDG